MGASAAALPRDAVTARLAPPIVETAVGSVRTAGQEIDGAVAPVLEGRAPSPGSDELSATQGRLSGSLASAALTIGDVQEQLRAVGAEAGRHIQRLINWLLDHVIRAVSKVADALQVDNWTVGVPGRFPGGVTVSITVTFK
jgi:hypothetical protein